MPRTTDGMQCDSQKLSVSTVKGRNPDNSYSGPIFADLLKSSTESGSKRLPRNIPFWPNPTTGRTLPERVSEFQYSSGSFRRSR